MKSIAKVFLLTLTLCIFNSSRSSAQTAPFLEAFCFGGQLNIKTNLPEIMAAQTSWQFNLNFGPGDPRTGFYYPSQVIPGLGLVRIIFSNPVLCMEEGDRNLLDFVFSFEGHSYVFINGLWCPTCTETNNTDCPTSVYCDGSENLILSYGFPLSGSSIKLETFGLYFGPNHPGNQVGTPPTIMNNTTLAWRHFEGCEQPLPPSFTVTVGDEVCYYENGQLVDHPACSPWSDFYDVSDPDCMTFFENCMPEFLSLLDQHEPEVMCRPWLELDENCSTNRLIHRTGRVAIGTDGHGPVGNYRLAVKDGIITNKLKVQSCDLGGWCDYVFNDDYRLLSLDEVEQYIQKNGHLHRTPSAAEVEAKGGINVKEVTLDQQEKIEEIFLHLIDLNNKLDTLNLEYETLLQENAMLKTGK